jgi:hypothetical protein
MDDVVVRRRLDEADAVATGVPVARRSYEPPIALDDDLTAVQVGAAFAAGIGVGFVLAILAVAA